MVWDLRPSVITYFKSDQCVLCGVFDPVTSHSFTIGFVYARNDAVDRKPLWDQIKRFSQSRLFRSSLWIFLGDFNGEFQSDLKYRGGLLSLSQSPIPLDGLSDFQDCLSSSGLFDIASRGCEFTWTNKSPTNPKARKLDRALINEKWLDCFPDSNAFFDVPGTSDHSPCLISLTASNTRRVSRFIFYSMFTTHPDYSTLISAAWLAQIIPADPMFSLYQRLRAAKECCKNINRTTFSGIQNRAPPSF